MHCPGNKFGGGLFSAPKGRYLEEIMDRRIFLTGVLGLAGSALVASLVKPGAAVAGVPGTAGGILGELDSPLSDLADDGYDRPELENAQYRENRGPSPNRRDERRSGRRPRQPPTWRTVCRRVRSHGRWYRRCWRERVRVWR